MTTRDDVPAGGSEAERVFGRIYAQRSWGTNPDGSASSGPGSDPAYARPYLTFVRDLLESKKIRSVVDVGCGDGRLAAAIDWTGVRYVGVDCVREVLDVARAGLAGDNVSFLHLDATRDELPAAEVYLLKDVLQHLDNATVVGILDRLCGVPEVRFIVITNCSDQRVDGQDVPSIGATRPLNAELEPLRRYKPSIVAEFESKQTCVICADSTREFAAIPPERLLEEARRRVEARLAGQQAPLFFRTELTVEEQIYKRGKPRPFLDAAVEILALLDAKTIVEIGSARAPMTHDLRTFRPACCNDGHSTFFWAETGLEVHTVDVDPRATAVVEAACAHLPNVHAWTADGVRFLEDYTETIDLLYLDAWDVSAGGSHAERHLAAWQAAAPRMRGTSLILIDDTDIGFGGKGRFCLPAMIREGYEPLVMARQTMLFRAKA
jgi:SAM-dependent methyltransferase